MTKVLLKLIACISRVFEMLLKRNIFDITYSCMCYSGAVILFIREDMLYTKMSSIRDKFNANTLVVKE